MKYLDPTNDYWIIDIETDGLVDVSRVWVMCYENAVTDEKGALTSEQSIKEWFAARPKAVFIGHNAVKFDLPTLNKLYGLGVGISRIVDTLILSQLYNPNLAGGHSLDSWAERFGRPKLTHDEWDKFSDEMVTYCYDDVATTKFIYNKLRNVLKKIDFSEKSIEIQHKAVSIIRRQTKNGFAFDAPGATTLRAKIIGEIDELTEKIRERFPAELVVVDTYKRPFNKDGAASRQYLRHVEKYPEVKLNDDGTYTAFDWREFNIGSPPQRVERLLALGWQPEEFTPKTEKGGGGNPRPTIKGELSPSLARFVDESGIEEVSLIAQWIALTGRSNMLGTWLDEYNERTGCIHGELWPASTLRWRHDHPNTANIPAVRVDKEDNVKLGREGYYTYEARGLWIPRAAGRVLVGTDAKALEYRMLAHHVNNKELTQVVLSRDVHQFTADMAGVGHDRGAGKTLNFAIIYGAGDAKAGSVIGGKAREGKAIKEKLFANIPGLGEAIAEARSEFKRGRISLVDGSKIICPTEHASFNYKLQGGGARIMFQAAIFLEGHIRRKGLDSLKVGDIHDEWQYDVLESDAEEHGRLACQAIREAGEELNTNIPMDGESKIGLTWAETH
jgi:DNA polymerase-1